MVFLVRVPRHFSFQRVFFQDVAMAFFVMECVVSLVHFLSTFLFTAVFVQHLSTFLASFDGFLAGIDTAIWVFNLLVVAATFLYDTTKLPCCVHVMMVGFMSNVLYTFRIMLGLFLWSPHVSPPTKNVKKYHYTECCVLYFSISLFLFVIHVAGLVLFAAVVKEYKEKKKRFLGFKEA
uniref:MARVEL domain-containing protein n=1 Tax=Steinernema glaseri TaxID=37863 RepID=A0A1I7XY28_9BILA